MSFIEKKGFAKLFYFPFIMLFFGVFSQTSHANVATILEVNNAISKTENNIKPLDSIVLIEIILVVNTDQEVKKVDIVDGNGVKVLKLKGCKSNSCEFDLSGLLPGDYMAVVLKGNGERISRQITLKANN